MSNERTVDSIDQELSALTSPTGQVTQPNITALLQRFSPLLVEGQHSTESNFAAAQQHALDQEIFMARQPGSPSTQPRPRSASPVNFALGNTTSDELVGGDKNTAQTENGSSKLAPTPNM